MTYKATSKTLHLKSRTGSYATRGNPATGTSLLTHMPGEAQHVDFLTPAQLGLAEALKERERLNNLIAKYKAERHKIFKGTTVKARHMLNPTNLARFEELGRRISASQTQVAALRSRIYELRTCAETDVTRFERLSRAAYAVLSDEHKKAVFRKYRELEQEEI